MKTTRRLTLLLVAASISFACRMQPAVEPVAAPAPVAAAAEVGSLDSLRAVLWMQTAAEYEAITIETYAAARQHLDAALADPNWNAVSEYQGSTAGLPPAIVLDLDETALDTSANQARLIRDRQPFAEERWHEYAMQGIARPIPAALEFLQYAHSRGVRIFYVTNRVVSEKEALRTNLQKLGFPFDADVETLLVKGERKDWQSSDKAPRRLFVASNYRVLFLFGDDLNDFVFANGKTIEDRAALVQQYKPNWGTKWYVTPNPVYGSWERSAMDNKPGLTEPQQIEIKKSKLRTDENYKP